MKLFFCQLGGTFECGCPTLVDICVTSAKLMKVFIMVDDYENSKFMRYWLRKCHRKYKCDLEVPSIAGVI